MDCTSLGPFTSRFFPQPCRARRNSSYGCACVLRATRKGLPACRRFFAALRKERVLLMIGLLVASSALHAEERRPTRGERLALEGRCEVAVPELEKELELVPAPESAHVAWRLGQCALRARDYARAADGPRARARDRSGASPRRTSISRARAITRATSTAPTPRCARARASRAKRSGSSTAAWSISGAAMRRPRCRRCSAPSTSTPRPSRRARIRRPSSRPRPTTSASRCAPRARRSARESGSHEVADSWAGTDWATQANRALGRTRGRRAWLTLGAGVGLRRQRRAGRAATRRCPKTSATRTTCFGVWLARGGIDLGSWGDDLGRAARQLPRARRTSIATTCASSTRTSRRRRCGSTTRCAPTRTCDSATTSATPGSTPIRILISNGGRLSLIHAWSARSSTELLRRVVRRRLPLSRSLDVPDGSVTPGAVSVAVPPPLHVLRAAFPERARGARSRRLRQRRRHLARADAAARVAARDSRSRRSRGGYAFHRLRSRRPRVHPRGPPLLLGLGFALPWSLGLDLEGSYT